MCTTSRGRGHWEVPCITSAALLAVPDANNVLPTVGLSAQEIDAFLDDQRERGLWNQMRETWFSESGASSHMTPCKVGIYDSAVRLLWIKMVNRDTVNDEGHSSIEIVF